MKTIYCLFGTFILLLGSSYSYAFFYIDSVSDLNQKGSIYVVDQHHIVEYEGVNKYVERYSGPNRVMEGEYKRKKILTITTVNETNPERRVSGNHVYISRFYPQKISSRGYIYEEPADSEYYNIERFKVEVSEFHTESINIAEPCKFLQKYETIRVYRIYSGSSLPDFSSISPQLKWSAEILNAKFQGDAPYFFMAVGNGHSSGPVTPKNTKRVCGALAVNVNTCRMKCIKYSTVPPVFTNNKALAEKMWEDVYSKIPQNQWVDSSDKPTYSPW